MSKIHNFQHSLIAFFEKRKNSMSFEHQYGMKQRLRAMGSEIQQLGFKLTHIERLKQKHVKALVKHWQEKGIANATMKNRMADLRFICEGMGRKNVIFSSNAEYGIGKRVYVPKENKAIVDIDFSGIKDKHLSISLELQISNVN